MAIGDYFSIFAFLYAPHFFLVCIRVSTFSFCFIVFEILNDLIVWSLSYCLCVRLSSDQPPSSRHPYCHVNWVTSADIPLLHLSNMPRLFEIRFTYSPRARIDLPN